MKSTLTLCFPGTNLKFLSPIKCVFRNGKQPSFENREKPNEQFADCLDPFG